ncbi:MAG: ATP-binding cassette domain-containing protein [Rhizobiales bacterium]|nr:ATP-binding cassette domain-containing protein [Hyphomicrobiales bacterium]
MAPPLLSLDRIHLSFGGDPLLVDAALVIAPRDRLCLVGRNGSGKSTLLKVAAGLVEPDGGERFLQPGTTVRYLEQEPDLAGYPTIGDYVEGGLEDGDDPNRARLLLLELGLDPARPAQALSGGEARRAALARVLAPEPDIVLLDEPTNHLDLPAIEWLEAKLLAMRSAIVLISHDRRFLERLSRATVWLERGQTRRLEASFASFEAWRDEFFEREASERHKLDRRIAMEEDWIRYGVTARRKRNQGRLRRLGELREARRTARQASGNVALKALDAELSGKRVIEAEGVSFSFGERAIVRDLTLRVHRGDRLAIVGANGVGKTTLINLLMGAIVPTTGTVKLGTGLEVVTLDQRREALMPDWTLGEAITDGRGDSVVIGGQQRHVVSYMKDFLFTPEQVRSPVGVLSGGERGRLMLARALARPANLLVLDEPTNDLDLETLDLLEELLSGFEGTVILVSHDRDFIDRVATSTLAGEGDGSWIEYAGGYSDMLAQRRQAPAGDGRSGAGRRASEPRAGGRSSEARPAAPAPAAPGKLSFKEKHALATLPATIAALEEKLAKVEAVLAEPGLYARDAARFQKAVDAHARLKGELTAAEEQWLELEVRREALEGG